MERDIGVMLPRDGYGITECIAYYVVYGNATCGIGIQHDIDHVHS